MKRLFILLISLIGVVKGFAQPTGALNGLFSISEGQQVYFSKANLQYRASTNTWRFADHQWDCIGGGEGTTISPYNGNVSGSSNYYISSSYSGWIDLFGYGTSGWNSGATYYQPWSSASDNNSTGYLSDNLTGNYSNADWGVYNAIGNGGNQSGFWRVLSIEEWSYLLNSRPGVRYAKATVNEVCGVIILPDNWSTAIYNLNKTNIITAAYNINTISSTDWTNILEANGAVFLPAAGTRKGTGVSSLDSFGYYRSSNSGQVWVFYYSQYGSPQNYMCSMSFYNCYGCSVRLVHQIDTPASVTIQASPNPLVGGSVMGAGTYNQGTQCSLVATANPGYSFVGWTKDGVQVSTSPVYTFIVTTNATYEAVFSLNTYTITASVYPNNAGAVSGQGIYNYGGSCVGSFGYGSTCTLLATEYPGYSFVNWTEYGTPVSENATYSFVVTCGRDLVANFEEAPAVGEIHFDLYDAMGDGWNGNYLVVTYGGRTTEQLTVTSGSSSSYTLSIPDGSHVVLTWIEGGSPEQCSFTVSYPNGNAICQGVNMSADYTYEFDVDFTGMPATTTFTQTTSLPSGWTWWSTYMEAEDILAQMEEGLGEAGVTIKSQADGFVTNYGMWYGLLDGIDNESTYLIQTDAPCQMSVTGGCATASTHPISLPTGWTWLGYPCGTSMSVGTAMSGLTPMANDQLKSQQGFSIYTPGVGWMGSLQTLTPGMGLMYESHSTAPLTLTYPSASKPGELKGNVTSKGNHWEPEVERYPYNMTMVVVVELDGEELLSEDYELAAFAGGECRGSVGLMRVDAMGRSYAFLTVYGDVPEEMSFGLYDKRTGREYMNTEMRLDFEANATEGNLLEPYRIEFRGETGVDENGVQVKVFPNPVRRGEVVNIGMSGEGGSMQVEVINAVGVVEKTYVLSQQKTTAIKAPTKAGVFTLRITIDNKICYRRLVVE